MATVDKIVPWTGWMFTDATAAMNCPRCGEPAGKNCRTPKGRQTNTPHVERMAALAATGYGANRRVFARHHSTNINQGEKTCSIP